MKKIIIIILTLALTIKLFSQAYTSFIDTNSIWRDWTYSYQWHNASFLDEEYWDSQEKLNGDTIINTKNYTKLYLIGKKRHYKYDHGEMIDLTTFYCNKYIGALREDTLKHVYYCDTTGKEVILFNFNLNIGDSIRSAFISYGPYWVVDSIDSILVFDKYRKRFNLKSILGKLELIEGIGTNLGLLSRLISYDLGWDKLYAFYYKSEKSYSAYPNIDLLKCTFTDIDNSYTKNPKLQIYPNPFNDNIIIELSDDNLNKVNLLSIVDNIGKIVYNRKIYSNYVQLDLHYLADGLYFIKIISNKNDCMFNKLIKITNH